MAEATVVGRVAWMRLRGPAGPLRARIYWPSREGGGLPPALLVFFHASGFVPGSVETADVLCRELCSRSGLVVLSASYRTAPPHPYPAAFEDATAAVDWAADHGTELDADPGRLLVAGEGAGGNLAAAVALHARDRGWPLLSRQLLIYPNLDSEQNGRSYVEHANSTPNSAARMRWYYEHYLPGGVASADPYASPLSAASVAAVAPATVVTVEGDPLRDDGRRYAARLRRAGVAVRELRYDGLTHGTLARPGEPAADGMLADLVRTLRRRTEPGPAP